MADEKYYGLEMSANLTLAEVIEFLKIVGLRISEEQYLRLSETLRAKLVKNNLDNAR